MGEVVDGHFITRLPVPVEKILRKAVERHAERPLLRVVFIATYADDPNEHYFAFSEPDGGTILWDLEMTKDALIRAAKEYAE